MKVIPDTRRARTEFDIYVLITETLNPTENRELRCSERVSSSCSTSSTRCVTPSLTI